MSVRSRPRNSLVKDENAEELQLWNTIVDKIRKCNAISEKYEEIASRIPEAEESVPEDDPSSAVIVLSNLEENHRACLKHSEQLLKILNDEPDDLIKNLETLISVRGALEVESPPPASLPSATAPGASSNAQTVAGTANSSSRATPAPTTNSSKALRGKRKFDSDTTADGTPEPTVIITSGPGVGGLTAGGAPGSAGGRTTGRAASRSGSVAAGSVKSEAGLEAAEAVKNVATDKQNATRFAVGSEVYFRNKGRQAEGEGILCRITNIIGEGKHRRYEVQDTEPDPSQEATGPWKAAITSLIAVPPPGTTLPPVPKGKQVFALYPNTNTFYRAEMTGMRKEMCRVKFEGEEEPDKELDVERRFVLDSR